MHEYRAETYLSFVKGILANPTKLFCLIWKQILLQLPRSLKISVQIVHKNSLLLVYLCLNVSGVYKTK